MVLEVNKVAGTKLYSAEQSENVSAGSSSTGSIGINGNNAYGDEGLVCETSSSAPPKKKDPTDRTEYKYDSNGQVSEYKHTKPDGSYTKEKYTYNSMGQISKVEEESTNNHGNGVHKYTYTYEYDSRGNVVHKKCKDSNNNVLSDDTATYDSNGRMKTFTNIRGEKVIWNY